MRLANDSVLLDSAEIKNAFEALSQELIFLSPTLNFIGYQAQKIVTFTQTIAEREQSIAALQAQAQDLQAQAQDLQAQAQDQLKDAAWMTSQRDAWEQSAVQSHQAVATLDAKLYKIRSHWGMRLINLLCKNKIL
jgi:chromosome segregation ATPase